MRRFEYDDHDDFKDEIDNFWPNEDFWTGDGDDEPYIEKVDVINMLQIDMVEYELNQRILMLSLKFCQSSFWWRFKSLTKKLETLKYVYGTFLETLERDKPDPPELEMEEE